MTKEIRVCNCGGPLMWTMHVAYAEYYCMHCGDSFGMMGSGKDVEETPELRHRQKLYSRVFKTIRKDLLPNCKFGRVGCKKCVGSDRNHLAHATKSELAKSEQAYELLKQITK